MSSKKNALTFIGRRPYQRWQADLWTIPSNMVKYNDNYKYILLVIDCFSKYLYCIPLRNKESRFISKVFSKIFSEFEVIPDDSINYIRKKYNESGEILFNREIRTFYPQLAWNDKINKYIFLMKPATLLSDLGPEFYNEKLINVCRKHQVYPLYTRGYQPLGIIERAVGTVKRIVLNYCKENNTKYFISIFDELIQNLYNRKIHSTIGYAPIEVHFNLPSVKYDQINFQIYNKFIEYRKKRFPNKYTPFEINELVKVKLNKSPYLTFEKQFPFRKSNKFDENHLFIVKKVIYDDKYNSNMIRYKLKTFPKLQEIDYKFYHDDLKIN